MSVQKASREVGNARLLQLAEMLEMIPARHREDNGNYSGYDQNKIMHPCGSPACAWGHWFARNHERIGKEQPSLYREVPNRHDVLVPWMGIEGAEVEFGLPESRVYELFASTGCGYATTGHEAAKYIRQFVANRAIHGGNNE